LRYRSEIDGLRAVAVIPVIFFHAGIESFKGGFVGVDVFFVVSGYLITSIILSDLEKNTFSLINFYERRIRRILPALFVVSAVCVPIASIWLLPTDTVNFAKSLIGVTTFSSNIIFWLDSGYFDTAAELKPLLHTWSLAVEEQYYLLFPLFMIITIRLGFRWSLTILVIIFFVSLILAHWASFNRPSAAFYLLPARAWEILLGSFVAYYASRIYQIKIPKVLEQILGALGLLLIVFSVLYFDEETPSPGLYMLCPTIGAALVIVFATQGTFVQYVLSTKIMVGIGLISYSLYLWHQPLFAFSKYINFDPLGHTEIFLLMALAFILAYLTWRFIETPFRDRKRINRKIVFRIVLASFLVLLGSALVLVEKRGFPQKLDGIYSVQAQEKENALRKEFIAFTGEPDETKPIIIVLGDSHIDAWSIGLMKHFDLSQYDILSLYYGSCDVSIRGTAVDASATNPVHEENCVYLQKNLNDQNMMSRVKAIFLASYRPFEYELNLFRFQLIDHIEDLANQPDIFVMGNYFQFDGNRSGRTCLSLMFVTGSDASICKKYANYPTKEWNYKYRKYYPEIKKDFTFIDIIKLHCDGDKFPSCRHTFNGVPFMLDSNHLTVTFIIGLLDQIVSEKSDMIRSMGLAKYLKKQPLLTD
tara:strand:- start:44 stop:1978 length:1935 start_codon:yes stop_codon:yes gene_type:complete